MHVVIHFKHRNKNMYISCLLQIKHVPVRMCFRFPNVQKTWEQRSKPFGVIIQVLKAFPRCGDFFRGDKSSTFCRMVNIFTYACPNYSRVGAIDSPDQCEHVFDPHYILGVLEKYFKHETSIIRP